MSEKTQKYPPPRKPFRKIVWLFLSALLFIVLSPIPFDIPKFADFIAIGALIAIIIIFIFWFVPVVWSIWEGWAEFTQDIKEELSQWPITLQALVVFAVLGPLLYIFYMFIAEMWTGELTLETENANAVNPEADSLPYLVGAVLQLLGIHKFDNSLAFATTLAFLSMTGVGMWFANKSRDNREKELQETKEANEVERRHKSTERLREALSLLDKQMPSQVRIAAHMLDDIIKEDPKNEHKRIVDFVTTWLKEKSPLPRERDEEEEKEDKKTRQENIYTLIEIVVGVERKESGVLDEIYKKQSEHWPDLTHINLSGIRFPRQTFLQKANLEKAHLEDADLLDANLERANLGRANLQDANLEGANLQHADLQDANLEGANLQNVHLQHANLEQANLEQANLQHANLQHANLQYAKLQDAKLQDAKLQDAKLPWAELQNANLQGAKLPNVGLYGASLQKANLRFAELQHADLEGADLHNAELQDAKLQHAKLLKANLEGANLEGAKLQRADLQHAELQDTELQGAELQDAKLQYAYLHNAKLQRANLEGAHLGTADISKADFSNAQNLTQQQIDGTIWQKERPPILDAHLEPPLKYMYTLHRFSKLQILVFPEQRTVSLRRPSNWFFYGSFIYTDDKVYYFQRSIFPVFKDGYWKVVVDSTTQEIEPTQIFDTKEQFDEFINTKLIEDMFINIESIEAPDLYWDFDDYPKESTAPLKGDL